MHLEFHVEDQSTKNFVEIILPRIINITLIDDVKYIHYKGVGKLPAKSTVGDKPNYSKLLEVFPNIIRDHNHMIDSNYFLIFICDLDENNQEEFMKPINAIVQYYPNAAKSIFILAIQELEAWLLGDVKTLRNHYLKAATVTALDHYDPKTEAQFGKWEFLADAIHMGGSESLRSDGYQAIGKAKSDWVKKIAPHLDLENNSSPSFIEFRDRLRQIATAPT